MVEETSGDVKCPECGRRLGNAVRELVELNPHQDLPPSASRSSRWKAAPQVRLFVPVKPSPADLSRARDLAVLTDCPRRYCWWWKSLAFEWDVPVAEGCTFLQAQKPSDWRYT